MRSYIRHRLTRSAAAAALIALALSSARADVKRTGDEPWYSPQQGSPANRQRARELNARGVAALEEFLRGDAKKLYVQALELWDNPDIRWNLALVLEDLGEYLRAHDQLESALRWGQALGDERLRQVRDKMRELETRNLALLDASTDKDMAVVKLDGKPWFRGPDRRRAFVLPGEHYVSAGKPGYFPVTRSVIAKAGQHARVLLELFTAEELTEYRPRWAPWKPWAVVASGGVVAAAGGILERQAFAHRDDAVDELADACAEFPCPPGSTPDIYDRAVTENRVAIGVLAVGGTAVAVGLALAWLNQPRAYRTEARDLSPIELTPILSSDQTGVSARIRF